MACSQPRSSCSLFQVDERWMMLLWDVDRVWPQRAEEILLCQVGAVHERLPRWEKVTSGYRTPWLYCDPHPSISDTSMWDKSIMCLCSNCDNNVWTAVSGGNILKNTYVVLRTICTAEHHIGNMQRLPTTVCYHSTGIYKMKRGRNIDYLWKLIWKLAACWGLENVAIAFLCWGIIENICNTQK